MVVCIFVYFFVIDSGTTEIYTYLHTLSLHDSLPICLAGLEGLAMIAVLLPAAARHDLGFALTGKGGQVLDDLERALDKLEAYRAEKKKLSLAWSDAAIAAAEVETWKSQWRAAADKIWPFGALAQIGRASCRERVCQYV